MDVKWKSFSHFNFRFLFADVICDRSIKKWKYLSELPARSQTHTYTRSRKYIQTQLPNPQFVLWYCVKSFDFVI